jgi:hypothetical protein
MRFHFHVVRFVVPALATAQQAQNNEAIVKMTVKAGLAEELIVSTIQSQPGSYSLGADDLTTLKSAGVRDKILAPMVPGVRRESRVQRPQQKMIRLLRHR